MPPVVSVAREAIELTCHWKDVCMFDGLIVGGESEHAVGV